MFREGERQIIVTVRHDTRDRARSPRSLSLSPWRGQNEEQVQHLLASGHSAGVLVNLYVADLFSFTQGQY